MSDPGGVLASPLATVERGRSHADDHRRIAQLLTDNAAVGLVVGLPLSLDGSRGPAARLVEAEVAELRAAFEVPVILHDERLTTVSAARSMQARGVNAKRQRSIVDQEAAAVLLQAWLDGGASRDGSVG